jgi:hypothetical protein
MAMKRLAGAGDGSTVIYNETDKDLEGMGKVIEIADFIIPRHEGLRHKWCSIMEDTWQ